MRYAVIAVLLPVLAGCGSSRDAELKVKLEAEQAELAAATRECNAKIKSRTENARCLNEAEERSFRPSYGHADLLKLRFATRLSLAEKVDHRQLTQADADLEFAKANAFIASEVQRRDNNARGVAAQESAAASAHAASRSRRMHCVGGYVTTPTCF